MLSKLTIVVILLLKLYFIFIPIVVASCFAQVMSIKKKRNKSYKEKIPKKKNKLQEPFFYLLSKEIIVYNEAV